MREDVAEGCHRKGDMYADIIRLCRTRKFLGTEINQADVTLLYIFAVLGTVLDIHRAVLLLRQIHADYAVSWKCGEER